MPASATAALATALPTPAAKVITNSTDYDEDELQVVTDDRPAVRKHPVVVQQ